MTTPTMIPFAGNPRDFFLTPAEVFSRYRWGRTKGYAMLRTPTFPRAIGGRYRLDTLLEWEDVQLGRGVDATEVAPAPASSTPPTLPARRKGGRKPAGDQKAAA